MDTQEIDLKYPIGKFKFPTEYTGDLLSEWISKIEDLPSLLKSEAENLSEAQLQYRYRPDGWNIRQVVHHLADSHMNSFMRFKLSLTETSPAIIRPYLEDQWALLPDVTEAPVSISLQMIDALHKRWVILLRSMNNDQFEREYVNPEYKRTYQLFEATSLYAWHGQHHLAHIKQAMERKD